MKTQTFTWNKGDDRTLSLYVDHLQQIGLSIIQIIITRQQEKFNPRINETIKYLDTTEALIICKQNIKPKTKKPAIDFYEAAVEYLNDKSKIQKAIEEVLPIHKRLIISSANTSIGIGNIIILDSEQIQYINDEDNFIVYTHEDKAFKIEFYAYTWIDSQGKETDA